MIRENQRLLNHLNVLSDAVLTFLALPIAYWIRFFLMPSGVKGHTDLLQRSGAGLLYPYGDEELCAEAIQMLLGSEDMREHLGAAGRREVVQYSLDQALPGIMELYEELALEDKAKPVAR